MTSRIPRSALLHAATQTRVSTFVADGKTETLEQYAAAHGLEKAHVIKEKLLHHLPAPQGLPADVFTPARLAITG